MNFPEIDNVFKLNKMKHGLFIAVVLLLSTHVSAQLTQVWEAHINQDILALESPDFEDNQRLSVKVTCVVNHQDQILVTGSMFGGMLDKQFNCILSYNQDGELNWYHR